MTFETATGIIDEDDDEVTTDEDLLPDEPIAVDEPIEAIVLRPAKRGECRVCGEKAKDGRSFYCDEHLQFSPSATKINPLDRPHRNGPAPDVSRRRGLKRKIKDQILKANPQIVWAGQQLAQIPDDFLDRKVMEGEIEKPDGSRMRVVFWDPPLRTQLEFTEREASMIADAAVQFAESNQGTQLTNLLGTLAPYVTLIGAGGVVVMHWIKLNQIKNSVAQVKDALHQVEQPHEAASVTDITDEAFRGYEGVA